MSKQADPVSAERAIAAPTNADAAPPVEVISGRGKHPNSRANLHPFPPGVSGNPSGKRGPIITPHLERMSEMTLEELKALDEGKLRVGEAIARQRLLRALDPTWGWRDTDAIQDRLDGPVEKSSRGDSTHTVMALTRIVRVVGGSETETRRLTTSDDEQAR